MNKRGEEGGEEEGVYSFQSGTKLYTCILDRSLIVYIRGIVLPQALCLHALDIVDGQWRKQRAGLQS